MAFDVWILCLIGSAIAMCAVTLAQDLVRGVRRVRALEESKRAMEISIGPDRPEHTFLVPALRRTVLAYPSPRSRAIQALLAGTVQPAKALPFRPLKAQRTVAR